MRLKRVGINSSVVKISLLTLLLSGVLLALDGGVAFTDHETTTASINANPTSGTAPLTVSFTGSGSPASDPGCNPHTWSWDFGDGSTATSRTPFIPTITRGRTA